MAGHSQFKNIMHRKGAQDKKRAQQFAKLAREIIVAAKSGLPDPEKNPRLRAAVLAARAGNMPKDNIERAISKAAGAGEGENYEAIRYEGYGPGGVAVIVEALTDNRNRTASEVRTAFSKHGGALGETNSVSFMFDRIGSMSFPATLNFDQLFEAAVEAGALDVENTGEGFDVITSPDDFHEVRDRLAGAFGDPTEAGLRWKPKSLTPVDEAQATTLLKLLDALDDSDDVQQVFANYDIDEKLLEKLAAA